MKINFHYTIQMLILPFFLSACITSTPNTGHSQPSSQPSSSKTTSTHRSDSSLDHQYPAFPNVVDVKSWLTDHQEQAIAIFAGGCFWCVEEPFDKLPGVFAALSGYTGGHEDHPTYQQVSHQQSTHKEAVIIFYDPKQVSYQQLLDLFWRQIDPTQADGQFADRGPQYQTVIYTINDEQDRLATRSLNQLAKSKRFQKDIVTQIKMTNTFWPAEKYHQNYHQTNRVHYLRYKTGSGRANFIKKVWHE